MSNSVETIRSASLRRGALSQSPSAVRGTGVRIGFDISALDPEFKSHATRGIGRYVRELLRYYQSVGCGPESDKSNDLDIGYFDHHDLSGKGLLSRLIDYAPVGKMTLKGQLLAPHRLSSKKELGFDIIHFPAHMDAPARGRHRSIITVLDLIPLVLSDLYKADRPTWRFHLARFLELRAIKSADMVLAISECTARDVHQILGVPWDRIRVTPLGIDQSFFVPKRIMSEDALRNELGIPQKRPIVLYVGGIDPRKNWERLLISLKEVRDHLNSLGSEPPVAVFVGKLETQYEYPRFQKVIRDLGLEGDTVLPGFLSDEKLQELFSITCLFAFLSLYEGFGLPPLEAMAAGVPVLSSNTSCLPEVLGNAASFVSPTDERAITEELLALLLAPGERRRLGEAGVLQARKFTWENTGERTLRAYEECQVISCPE